MTLWSNSTSLRRDAISLMEIKALLHCVLEL
jgi:hypothetical protein